MQRIFLTFVALGALVSHVFGQGIVTFSAGSSVTNAISYSTDGVTSTPYPLSPGLPAYGNGNVGFFTAAAGTILTLLNGLPDFSAWTPSATVLPIGSAPTFAPGTAATFTLSLPVTAGNNVELEVVGWSGAFPSWAAAVTSGTALVGFSGEIFNSAQVGALGWSQPTTSGIPIGASLTAGQFSGIIMKPLNVPEPSTYALGGLGAGLLLLFRRLTTRKSQ